MMRRLMIPLAVTAAVLVQSPCFADTAPAAGGSCALLMGGGATKSTDTDTNARWLAASSDLSHAVGQALSKKGYRLSDFIVYIPDPELRARTLEQTLLKTGCGKVLQVFFDASAKPPAAGGTAATGFVVTVSRLEQSGATGRNRAVSIVEEYDVEYEYVPGRPKPTLDEVAQDVAADVDKAHVLPR